MNKQFITQLNGDIDQPKVDYLANDFFTRLTDKDTIIKLEYEVINEPYGDDVIPTGHMMIMIDRDENKKPPLKETTHLEVKEFHGSLDNPDILDDLNEFIRENNYRIQVLDVIYKPTEEVVYEGDDEYVIVISNALIVYEVHETK